MLKCNLDDKTGAGHISVKGDLITVLSDVIFLISYIYRLIQRDNQLVADAFENALREFIKDDSPPIWQTQEAHEVEEAGVKDVSIQIPRDILDGFMGGEHDE